EGLGVGTGFVDLLPVGRIEVLAQRPDRVADFLVFHQSALMLASCTTLAQRATSLFRNTPNSSELLATTSTPAFWKRSVISGVRMIFTISVFSRCTISFEVPAGARMPNHTVT